MKMFKKKTKTGGKIKKDKICVLSHVLDFGHLET